ncbi:MAG TPA: lysophospholipid acyltransferase family protein [Thermoanaerobaculia bacterium]|jgi:1-acyl-sn-glycerol-3-phosphate acyltransferase|nr:lysophospholipid acyltransferase family protein [Thermoanaerobaculia bacterium]
MEIDSSRAGETPRAPAIRAWSDPLRWLFIPWTLFIFYPAVLTTTTFWGIIAILIASVSQRAGFYCGTIWAWCLAWLSPVWVRVEGRENTRPEQSYVILTNHQGDYDILALYGFLHRQFRWVIKQELRKVPFLGWGCAAIGHIFVDRRNSEAAIASLEAAKPRLAGGVSVLFFPEGTRSLDGRLGPFKKGGFVMARQLGFPILPVSLSGSWKILPKGCLFPCPGIIRVRIHPPVDPADFPNDEDLMGVVRGVIAAGIDEENSI